MNNVYVLKKDNILMGVFKSGASAKKFLEDNDYLIVDTYIHTDSYIEYGVIEKSKMRGGAKVEYMSVMKWEVIE